MASSQKITPYLWFDTQAEEAANIYCSLFPDSQVGAIQRQGDAAMIVPFSLSGQSFTAFNGGPMFTFNPSISLYVVCEREEELTHAWETLVEGGSALMPLDAYPWSAKYGWLQDKFGLSWQLTLGKISDVGQKIAPVLMYTGDQHGKAETAMEWYTSLFHDSTVKLMARYEAGDGDPAIGTLKHAEFQLDGYTLMAMDSSHMHQFAFNEAISFVVHCQGQEEVDFFWDKLTADGGEEMMCAWLKDKFGVAWQIVPDEMFTLLSDPDPARAQRALGAMMQMRKIDLEKMRQAVEDENQQVLTVQTTVNAPLERVWEMWTNPEHIVNWNFATEGWCCPRAENELAVGGRFSYRMEARDGSMGFDYAGRFTAVAPPKALEFALEDGRKVQVHFSEVDGGTFVMETFEADSETPLDMQEKGWQAILGNFKQHVEATP